MNLFYELLGEVIVVASAQAAHQVFGQVIGVIRTWGHKNDAERIRRFLEE